ncbi:MAG: 1,4-dihydroxy-2-naphthoate octaprenyltransferase [Dehalococcoidia bacterium]
MAHDKATVEQRVEQVLRENGVMNLATQGDEGPCCVSLLFVAEGFDVLCLVANDGRTMADLRRNPRVAFTVSSQVPEVFVQGSGLAYVVGPPAENPALFDFMCERQPRLRELVQTGSGLMIVRLVCERLALSDLPAGIHAQVALFRRGDDWFLAEEVAVPRGLVAWFLALRPWSFPASVVPMLVGGALAYRADFWNWPLFLLTLVGGLCFHIGANLTNTYFDFRRGADSSAHADDRTLVDSMLRPRDVLLLTVFFFLAGSALGGYLAFESGWELLALGAAGLFLGLFYTSAPLGYKYWALGDVGIFISFGPLLVLGSYFVQTEKLDVLPLLFSLPLGLLIVAILHANNYRDAQADQRIGARTLAQALGERGSRYAYYFLVLSPYAFVMAFGVAVTPWVLLALPTIVLPLKMVRQLNVTGDELRRALAFLPQQTANFIVVFGGLMAIGILVSELV